MEQWSNFYFSLISSVLHHATLLLWFVPSHCCHHCCFQLAAAFGKNSSKLWWMDCATCPAQHELAASKWTEWSFTPPIENQLETKTELTVERTWQQVILDVAVCKPVLTSSSWHWTIQDTSNICKTFSLLNEASPSAVRIDLNLMQIAVLKNFVVLLFFKFSKVYFLQNTWIEV